MRREIRTCQLQFHHLEEPHKGVLYELMSYALYFLRFTSLAVFDLLPSWQKLAYAQAVPATAGQHSQCMSHLLWRRQCHHAVRAEIRESKEACEVTKPTHVVALVDLHQSGSSLFEINREACLDQVVPKGVASKAPSIVNRGGSAGQGLPAESVLVTEEFLLVLDVSWISGTETIEMVVEVFGTGEHDTLLLRWDHLTGDILRAKQDGAQYQDGEKAAPCREELRSRRRLYKTLVEQRTRRS